MRWKGLNVLDLRMQFDISNTDNDWLQFNKENISYYKKVDINLDIEEKLCNCFDLQSQIKSGVCRLKKQEIFSKKQIF